MTVPQLERYILERYGVAPDYPWSDPADADYAVFRHANNRKWFALLMTVPAQRLGLPPREAPLAVLNVKADPALIGSMLGARGVYPAYHMNRQHWLSLALGEIDGETLRFLLERSYDLTAVKPKRSRGKQKTPPGDGQKKFFDRLQTDAPRSIRLRG